MPESITNILMVGVGGQGTVLSSDILTLAAMYDGHDAKKSEIHGMSQRGGSVFSHVRFGRQVHSPVIPEGEADVLLSLEELETLRWLDYLRPNAAIICLKERILPATITEYPDGIPEFLADKYPRSRFADPATLKNLLGNNKVLNVALLGMLSRLISVSIPSWTRAISELVPPGTQELNLKAFEIGGNIQ